MKKDIEDISIVPEPGFYVLTNDVVNPCPDRRSRYNWTKKEVWKKGTKLRVSEVERFNPGGQFSKEELDKVYSNRREVAMVGELGDRIIINGPYRSPDHAQWRAMMGHLEWISEQDNLPLTLAKLHFNIQTIVCKLLDEGVLSTDTIKAAANLCEEMSEEELEAMFRKWGY